MTAPCPTFGFVVSIQLETSVDAAAEQRFWASWRALLDGRGLYESGGGGESLERVIASEAAQATDSDREAVRHWLGARSDVHRWQVGELIDLSQAV